MVSIFYTAMTSEEKLIPRTRYVQIGQSNLFKILAIVFLIVYIFSSHVKITVVYDYQNIYEELSKPPSYMKTLNRSMLGLKDLAIVTFISSNHVAESMVSCQTIQRVTELRRRPFYVYTADDIPDSVARVYKEICPIATVYKYSEIVKDLPPEFSALTNSYRFKPLVVSDVLRRHAIVLFADASIRFEQRKNNSISKTIRNILATSPVDLALLGTANHVMYPATHPSMYKFFPEVEIEKMKHTRQQQSGFTMFFGTPVGWNLAMRYLKCAFEPECYAPPNATSHGCKLSDIYNKPNVYSGCHRYDQSALNLIGYVESHGNFSLYAYGTDLFHVNRHPQF